MRLSLLIIIVCLFAAGCHHPAPVLKKLADSIKKDTTTTSQKIAESFPDTKMVGDTDNEKYAGEGYPERSWVDTLITNYVKHTKNKLVSFAVQHKLGEGWEFDQLIKTDTAVFFSYKVGHTVTEKDGSEPRYIADSWIMIDTLKHKLYETGANGRLTEWKR